MMDELGTLLDDMIGDPRHGWSIGTFGAIGEFVRNNHEVATIVKEGEARTIHTERGGLRVAPNADLKAIAYDTLSSDGETWGQSIAFCLPAPSRMIQDAVQALGPDLHAISETERTAELFDLGVGLGHVRFCLRTQDEALVQVLRGVAGESLFGAAGKDVMAEVLRAQPHRVLLSPIGRVEVYSPIPQPGGTSPEGPHTHLLPKLLQG